MGMGGSKKTLKEEMRENQRMINRAVRELDRERGKLEKQQKKLEIDIKKQAKAGQMGAVNVMAKDYVRTKKYITKFYAMRTNLQGVGLRMQTMQSTHAMGEAMRKATHSMIKMNKRMNMPQLQAIMQRFAMEMERTEMTEEVMGDAIDEMESDDEEETEMVVGQVLAEIGVDMAELPEAGSGAVGTGAAEAAPAPVATAPAAVGVGAPAAAAAAAPSTGAAGAGAGTGAATGSGADTLSDLEARLNNLRK